MTDQPILVVDQGGNEEPTTCIYVWIVEHGDGDEGIASVNNMPMMAGKYATAERLRPVAEQLAKAAGKPLKLVRFDAGLTLDRIG